MGGEFRLMKTYKVNQINKKLIREEIKEIDMAELPNIIRKLERDIEHKETKIVDLQGKLGTDKIELKELKKLAGENNVKY